ncbi:MAG: CIA30 family protein [Treponema sp.]|jgi:hypothetical protein|nr:CIA30 family protein [Treponema sp.]
MKKHVFLVRHLTHKQRMTGLVLLTAGLAPLLLLSCVTSSIINDSAGTDITQTGPIITLENPTANIPIGDNHLAWYTYRDAGDGGSSTITKNDEKTPGKAEIIHSFSGDVTTKYRYGYAGVVIALLAEELQTDLKNAAGLRFMFSGDGRAYRFSVDTSNVKDGNTFGQEITAPQNPKEVIILFKDLQQNDWEGSPHVPFDAGLITQLKIQTVGQPISSFNFKIWNLEIVH